MGQGERIFDLKTYVLDSDLKGGGHTRSKSFGFETRFNKPRLENFGLDCHVPNFEELGVKVGPFWGGNRMFPTPIKNGGFKSCKTANLGSKLKRDSYSQ